MKNRNIGIGIVLFCAITASTAFAQEPIAKIQLEQKQKQKAMLVLSKRIQRHQGMAVEAIREELLQSLEKNYQTLKSRGELTDQGSKVLNAVEARIKSFSTKEEMIGFEKAGQKLMASTTNLMFAFTRGFVANGKMDDASHLTALGLFSWFTISIDLIALPFTFIFSLLTCF
jgi:hypothetical protein